MSNLASLAHSQFNHLDQNLGQLSAFKNLEAKTKIPTTYWTSSLIVVYLLLTFLNVGGLGQILSNFVGFIIPTLNSIHALKSATKDDDTVWLAYWIIFGFLNVIEFWSSAILYLVPFYWVLKVLFLIYISIPATNGSMIIFHKVVEPIYDAVLGPKAASANDEIKNAVKSAGSAVSGSAAKASAAGSTASARSSGVSRH